MDNGDLLSKFFEGKDCGSTLKEGCKSLISFWQMTVIQFPLTSFSSQKPIKRMTEPHCTGSQTGTLFCWSKRSSEMRMFGCCPRQSGSLGRPSEEQPSGLWPLSQVSSLPPSKAHDSYFRLSQGIQRLTVRMRLRVGVGKFNENFSVYKNSQKKSR